MQLEFHQLERRWEHLRVRHPARQRRLLASLVEAGQQSPIVVVGAEGQANRYVVIDGYKRIAALQQLGRDTVEAVVWPMGEAEALLLDRSRRFSEQETALEHGWLLAEMEQRFGYGLAELARRFDRSVSWVSRRLALVELLPEGIQQQVREGKISAHVAMKYLVPVARVSLEDCQRMAAIFTQRHCDTRQAGQLYASWRQGSRAIRQRILAEPELFCKAPQVEPKATAPGVALLHDLQIVAAIVHRAARRLAGAAALELDRNQRASARRQIDRLEDQLRRLAGSIPQEPPPHVEPSATHHDSGTEPAGNGQARDRAGVGTLPCECAPGPALAGHSGSGVTPARESRTVPPTHPGAIQRVQGESRASP